jgi:HEAT repeat protein
LAAKFIDDSDKTTTQLDLALACADMLAELKDSSTDTKLAKMVGKGKGQAQLFALRAVRNIKDDKLDKNIVKLLVNDDESVAIGAAEALGARVSKASVPDLEAAMAKSKDQRFIAAVVDSLSLIHGDDAQWQQRLLALATSDKLEVRVAAVMQLAKQKNSAELLKALDSKDWSVRLAALKGLESLRNAESVAALIARMQQETGRMQVEFSEALWRLTGQPFHVNALAWKGWWE